MRRAILITMLSLLVFIAGCGMSEVSVQNKANTTPQNSVQPAPSEDQANWNAFHDEGMGY